MAYRDPERRRAYHRSYRRLHRARRPDLENGRVQRFAAKRRVFIDSLKSKPCFDCGGVFPPHVMQFDHRVPANKSFDIGTRYRTRSVIRILAEVEKCDVVCANCHAERTYRQRHLQEA